MRGLEGREARSWLTFHRQRRAPCFAVHRAAIAHTPQDLRDLAGPARLPFIGSAWLLFGARGASFHRTQLELVKKHGRIMRLDFGPGRGIGIADAKFMREYYNMEEALPVRMPPSAWPVCSASADMAPGLLTSQGTEWASLRKAVQPKVLRLDEVAVFGQRLSDVSSDLVKRLKEVRTARGLVPTLLAEMRHWAFEGICTVAYDERVGCLQSNTPSEMLDFISSVSVIHASAFNSVGIFPHVHRVLNTTAWQRTLAAWHTVSRVSKRFVHKKIDSMAARGDEQEQQETLLSYLVSKSALSQPRILALLADFMTGGVETVSNGACFLFYNLANNPGCQDKLFAEIHSVVGDDVPTIEHIRKMPYLKNCVKESLRMFPIVAVSGRNLQEPKTICNLHLPKNTMIMLLNYAMCHDSAYFNHPEQFLPERWNRDVMIDMIPFSALPFGHGVRSCIGRRLAEQQISFASIQVLRHYELRLQADHDLKVRFTSQLTALDPVPVLFVNRTK